MFILNNLENLIFAKNSEEPKKENFISEQISSFRDILNNTVSDLARVEPDKLQTYSAIEQDNKKEVNLDLADPFKAEVFNERLSRDNDIESFAVNLELSQEKVSSLESVSAIMEEETLENVDKISNLRVSEGNQSNQDLEKEISSAILLQTFLNLDKKETPLDSKFISSKNKPEIKTESKNISPDLNSLKKDLDGQIVVSPKLNFNVSKESEKKESKSLDIKTFSGESVQIKAKELKVEIDSKEVSIREIPKETEKNISKELKIEENPKLTLTQSKSKENPVIIQKNISDSKSEVSAVDLTEKSIQFSRGEVSSRELLTNESRKLKKLSESDSKDKFISENFKPVAKEFVGLEKEMRFTKETLVEVSGLDKSKWTITRREKDMEVSNMERRKESMTLLNEIAAKSSSSQNSSDSDKSFSNPRYETNGLKTFSENLKTANSDKPREALFDRENFSKSLNDLVNKARIHIVENGRNTAQISLYPKDLGKMTLNIDVIKEKVEGKILVDSEFIKNRLLGDVSQLKADLKANGLDLQTISIEVRSEGSLAFDFANPSSEKDSSKKDSNKANSSLPQLVSSDETLESEYSNKSYNLVDIKI